MLRAPLLLPTVLFAATLLTIVPADARAVDPKARLDALRAAALAPDAARKVEGVRLDVGVAALELHSGVLFPARNISEHGASGTDTPRTDDVEMVFIGRGTVELTPPDPIEAGQLELFTGAKRLRESFREAVLVLANDDARAALKDRSPARPADATIRRAEARWQAWQSSTERRLLDVEAARLLDALGDPAFDSSYFAAAFEGETLGRFLLLVDPAEDEQLTLGRFVPLDADAKERRRLARQVHREQRSGRLIGVEVDNLGTWDTWVSASLRTADGISSPGRPTAEPRHYVLDVRADPRSGMLTSRARLELEATADGRRALRLTLHPDLEVDEVLDGAGRPLLHLRSGDTIHAILAEPTRAGEPLVVEVRYGGRFFDGGGRRGAAGRAWALRDGLAWYPHAGHVDRATYDVTLRWPKKLELVAGGKRLDGGEDGKERWERRIVERPTLGFSFEVGRFEIRTLLTGHVTVRAAFDPAFRQLSADSMELIPAVVANALAFYEELFGPYPLDEITVVTVPRSYSQAMLGFITLSGLMAADWGLAGLLLGLDDPRTVIAHEVAHQWWGHRIGWASYRDQWISEAMASYAALLWARRHLGRSLVELAGPTSGWQDALTTRLADGRTIESLGPLVLGERLLSSRAEAAYQAIVYRKGAVVLDMLAQSFGEAELLTLLRRVSELSAGQVLSTQGLLELLERLGGVDLGPFSERFIYGTGLPEVTYSYNSEPLEEGRHLLRITARQDAAYRFRYAATRDADGHLDAVRVREDLHLVGETRLIVPFQVLFEGDGSGLRRGIEGRVQLDGPESVAEIEVDGRPEQVLLDPRGEVFARFFDAVRWPKASHLRRGRDLAAAGELDSARRELEMALVTDLAPHEDLPAEQRDEMSRRVDSRAHAELARIVLELGEDTTAAEHLARAKVLAPRTESEWMSREATQLEARLLLREGEAEEAARRLARRVESIAADSATPEVTELWVLYAIAARQAGQTEDFEKAVAEARQRGADVAQLVREEWVRELSGHSDGQP